MGRAVAENAFLIFETGLRFIAGVGICMDKEDDTTKSDRSFGEAQPLAEAFIDEMRAYPKRNHQSSSTKQAKNH